MANGYVRYGNSIHLDGFQILDFCIENAISLESLRDLNLGRKVFLTGNDTNAGYLRENVWDGDRWRAAAYLDDIDKITNGEGSLGTRVKALEDMLNVDSAETVVSTWEEIQAFLDNVKEGTDLMTMLDDKVSKSEGGRVRGTFDIASTGYPNIRFFQNDNYWGSLGFNRQDNAAIRYGSASAWYTLLHEGNVGDYALKTDGSNSMKSGIPFVANEAIDYNNAGSGIRMLFQSSANAPATWMRSLSVFEGSSGFQIGVKVLDYKERLYYRQTLTDNAWSDWKTIAFTDSDITGNAKGAYNLICNYNDKPASVAYVSGSQFYVGDTIYPTIATNILGKEIRLRTGESAATAMTITEEGNVLVGTTETKDTKLKVGGRTHIVGFELSEVTTLDNEPSSGLKIGSEGVALYQFMDLNGKGYIQAARFGANPYLFALNLNPLGGAVNVGSGGLNVKGGIVMSGGSVLDKISATSTLNIVSEQGQIYISSNIETDFTTAKGNIFFNGETFTPWTQNNNAISLGRSEARWSNVYSTLGNFSGRVLIGGAQDDGESALQVKGDIKLGSVAAIETYVSSESNGYLGLLSTGNEMIIEGKTNSDININYRRSKRGYAPKTWNWLAGSSTEYADFVLGHATFYGGAYIPSGQKLTIGSVTFEEDAAGRVKVDGDLYTTGTLASGGKAKEGTGTGSGSANVRDFELPADGKTTYDCDHLLKSKNVIVQVFEKTIQNYIEVWEMIVADVTIVTEDRVTVTFGRPHNKVHRVHIIGGNVS